jgi:hypothetical protein
MPAAADLAFRRDANLRSLDRRFAMPTLRKAWEPSIDDCRDLADRLVEYLKTRGALRIIREGGGENHSIGPTAPKRAPPPMPLWAPRPPRER